jgi:hypothetical protein
VGLKQKGFFRINSKGKYTRLHHSQKHPDYIQTASFQGILLSVLADLFTSPGRPLRLRPLRAARHLFTLIIISYYGIWYAVDKFANFIAAK